MTARVAALWRHPVKSHGRQAVDAVVLEAGRTMPGDRVWAVAHDASKTDGAVWAPPANFSRAAKAGRLQAISAVLDDATGRLALSHPDLDPVELDPETEGPRLIGWAAPLMPPDRAASARVVRVPGRGMTDSDFPSISLLNAASGQAVSDRAGTVLGMERWRGNVLLDGLEPWVEWDWIGRDLALGAARLQVRQRITRCTATRVDCATGREDADTLALLQDGWGHQDFGVYAVVTGGGRVAVGDSLRLL